MNTLNSAEKKLSSIALLLQAIVTVAIFLPFNYKEQWWKNYGDSYRLTNEHSINIFGGNYVRSGILGYLVQSLPLYSCCLEIAVGLLRLEFFHPLLHSYSSLL